MKRFREVIAELVAGATGGEPGEYTELITTPPRPELGDYAFPCFALAKKLKKSPPQIAADLAESLRRQRAPFAVVEAAGPYLNFRLDNVELARRVLSAVAEEGKRWGGAEEGAGQRVVIDYSSPNIAKPFHIGHLRSTVIGGALYRIYQRLGYEVVGINHLGDWGTQFGMVMAAFAESRDEAALAGDPIGYSLRLYVDYNRRCEEDEAAREQARAWFRRLEEGDAEAQALWRRFRDLSLAAFERIYERVGVHFDYYTGESFYNDRMEEVLRRPEVARVLERGEDGAALVRLDAFGLPPFLLRKSDGATLYATRELAAAFYREENFHPVKMLYVVGTPQELHFRQLIAALRAMGCEWADKIVHVKFGHIHGMSTRRGEVVLLEEVLDDAAAKAREKIDENIASGRLDAQVDRQRLAEAVGIGALVAHDLKHRRERDIHFDWDQVLQFDGETGPYLQYSYARIQGIFRKAGGAPTGEVNYAELNEPETRSLLRKLADFPETVGAAAAANEPSLITSYLFELTKAWNVFYTEHRVLGSGPAKEPARLALVAAAGQTLKNGLELVGIPVLERM